MKLTLNSRRHPTKIFAMAKAQREHHRVIKSVPLKLQKSRIHFGVNQLILQGNQARVKAFGFHPSQNLDHPRHAPNQLARNRYSPPIQRSPKQVQHQNHLNSI